MSLYTRLIFHQEKLTQWPFVGISPNSCWRRVHWDDAGTWDAKGSSMACRSSLFLLYTATRGPGTEQVPKASLKPLQLLPGIGWMFARRWAWEAHRPVQLPQRSSFLRYEEISPSSRLPAAGCCYTKHLGFDLFVMNSLPFILVRKLLVLWSGKEFRKKKKKACFVIF